MSILDEISCFDSFEKSRGANLKIRVLDVLYNLVFVKEACVLKIVGALFIRVTSFFQNSYVADFRPKGVSSTIPR